MTLNEQNISINSVLHTVIDTMHDIKGKNVISLNLKEINHAVTDYFIICSGSSHTQVEAIASHILENVQVKNGIKPYNKEGFKNSEWILIDYLDIVVHVFLESTRAFYQLEALWADAEEEYYSEQ